MHLSEKDLHSLIHSLKYPSKKFLLQDISEEVTSLFGTIDRSEKVIGIHDGIEYYFVVQRGNKDMKRYSLHLRFAENHIHLIRVDIGSSHRFPTGERLNESHIHFLWHPTTKDSNQVVPLSESNFPNIQTIVEAYENFICYTNIKELKEG